MFLNNAIHHLLNNKVDPAILKKGSELMKNRFVSNVEHSPKEKYLSAIVKDINKVTILYENAFNVTSMSCSCHFNGICEHIAATFYALLSMDDKSIKVTQVMHKRPERSPLSKKASVENVPAKNVQKVAEVSLLEKGSPQNFKLLPAGTGKELLKILTKIKPDFPQMFGYRIQYLQHLNNAGELEFIFIDRFSFEYKDLDPAELIDDPAIVRVAFKNENNNLYIKCSQCSRLQNKLCDHQFFALNQESFTQLLFSEVWKDRDQLVQNLSKNINLTPSKFEKIYKIGFNYSVPVAIPAMINYLSSEQLKKTKLLITERSKNYQNEYDLFVEKLTAKAKAQKANAFLWVAGGEEGHTPVLLEGTKQKTGEKLSSNIVAVSRPGYLSPLAADLTEHLLNLKEQFIKNYSEWYYSLLLKLLKEHKSTLKDIIHYLTEEYNEYRKISKSDLILFTFGEEEADIFVDTEENENFISYKMNLKIGEQLIDIDDTELILYPVFAIYNENAFLYSSYKVFRVLNEIVSPTVVTDIENPEPLIDILYEYSRYFDVSFPEKFKPEIVKSENPVKTLYLKEGGNYVIMEPRLVIENDLVVKVPSDGKILFEGAEESRAVLYESDVETEAAYIDFLNKQHPALEDAFRQYGVHYIDVRDLVKNAWFLKFFEACSQEGITIYGQENLKNFRFNTNVAKININVSSGIDWFDVNVDIAFGDQKVKLKNWVDSVRNNEKYVVLDDGSLGLIPDEWFEKLRQVALVSDEEKGKLTISKFRLGVVESLFEELSDDKLFVDIRKKMKQLAAYEFKKNYSIPSTIKAELREYQVMGFQWLKALSDLGFGGCLADDMGLGKTIQVISLLADQQQMKKGTSMAVVPRSLLFNWAAEIDKFCPDLRYIHYHGPERQTRRQELLEYDLVITTYDTATNDIEYFKEINFNYIILDESQAIKNPASKRYKAMRLLRADNRIVMTGTPIENNTFDLYAQFSFINPGIFGGQQYFREHFSNAIDKNNDADTADLLKKLINPFLLRRTKEQVASDLPDRTENVIYCEMDHIQRSYYDALKNAIRSEIEQSISKTGFDKVRFKIIEGLLRLRQVCNAPQLVDPSLPPHKRVSVKIETLLEIIENDLGNHNALIFSQFTSMLDIVKSALDKRHIKYAYLDGSTKDRKAAVDNFNDHDDIRLFLISLKAGNTGLNLTKADYVYLIDPWWNPAVEAQAIDRTHRIGQTKNVFAYKMICKNTIEEKILELQSKKKKLAGDLVVTDENAFKSLNKDELIGLFS
jgi:superfamily II DNA or RNA helicase